MIELPKALIDYHRGILNPLLDQWIETNHVGHAFLITGSRGIGKREVSHYLAQWLTCETKPSNENGEEELGFGPSLPQPAFTEPCGQCKSCRGILSGQSLNFTEIQPEASETGRNATLKIDQFRSLKETQGFGAFGGKFRIFLISQAEQMTPAAGNSLLKLLEEPPKNWIFFLTASDPSRVLPTLISRCQRIRLRPLPNKLISTLLIEQGVNADRSRLCTHYAEGSWRRAQQLAGDEIWKKRTELFHTLSAPQSDWDRWIDWGAQDPDHFTFLLDQLESAAHDLIESTVNPGFAISEPELGVHFKQTVEAQGSTRAARVFWLRCSQKLEQARAWAGLPLNRKLLLQDLLTSWSQVA